MRSFAGGEVPPPTGPGALSALLAELASAPARDLRAAWDRGYRPGDMVGRFELVRELGRGGFGVVFEARDRELGRRVAFKAIRFGGRGDHGGGDEELLRREAEAAAQLQHPNIVTLHDVGRCDSGPYLILELLRGQTVADRLKRGPLPVREALRVAVEVSRALVHAHERGVLHRDLKPSNVFLGTDGGVKVLDFGLAHLFGAGGPAGSGTPGYMAPEQERGGPEDARTDVFAAGVLLHEMVTGARLFAAERAGSAPRLDPGRVPAALADLVAHALAPDPAARPRDAQALLDALLAVEAALSRAEAGGRRAELRRALRWSVPALGAAAVVAAALALWPAARAPAPGRTVVAVADFVNETGEPDLDALSGMLITSLEQSRRLTVLPRARMLDLLGAARRGAVARIDGAAGREVARAAGAAALLLPAVKRDGGEYRVELAAVDPGAPGDVGALFAFSESAATREALPRLLDRLSDRARLALDDRVEGGAGVRIGDALTASVEAYRHYFLGEQCNEQQVYGVDCGAEFRRAVELDPTFALAHYQLAVWNRYFGAPRAVQQAAIDAALRHADRAPLKEQLLIRAWAAHLDGRDDEALELYRRITSSWPEDKRAFFEVADILRHRDEPAASLPWIERVVELDPDHGWALTHLVEALGVTGQLDALRARVRRWEQTPGPAALHAVSLAQGWLGDMPAAAEAARRAIALGGGLSAYEDLLATQVFVGGAEEAERASRELAAPGSAVRRLGFYALAALDAYAGRFGEGLAHLDRLRRELPEVESEVLYRSIRLDYLTGARRADLLWPEVEALQRLDPAAAAEHAVALAWLGDLEHARGVAPGLRPGSLLARTYEALVLFHQGERDRALADLRRIADEMPVSVWRVAPLFLYADLAAAAGRDAEAVEAIRRFHALYVPRMMWRSWAWPRSLYLLARSSERLGRPGEARDAVQRLLAAWRRADERDPLLADARALAARLGRARSAVPQRRR